MIQKAVCTIASKNYLGYVRTLAKSVAETNPDVEFYFLLVDKIDDFFDPGKEPFKLIRIEELRT